MAEAIREAQSTTARKLHKQGDVVTSVALALSRLNWGICDTTGITTDKGHRLDLEWGAPVALKKEVLRRIREPV